MVDASERYEMFVQFLEKNIGELSHEQLNRLYTAINALTHWEEQAIADAEPTYEYADERWE